MKHIQILHFTGGELGQEVQFCGPGCTAARAELEPCCGDHPAVLPVIDPHLCSQTLHISRLLYLLSLVCYYNNVMIHYYTCTLNLTKGKLEFQLGSEAILPKDDLPALCNVGGQKMEKCGKLTLVKAVLFWVTSDHFV